ncbi:MAG: XdhC family protein [Candidatus Brocadiae bacterium]|nr:XdhC family protein [Candidatus Brocadiia bacterium]
MNDLNIYYTIQKYRQKGEPVVLATVVESLGATPRKEGAKMLLLPDGEFLGTVGGGCVEGIVKKTAQRILSGKESPSTVKVDLIGEPGYREMDVCGGIMKIMLEKF